MDKISLSAKLRELEEPANIKTKLEQYPTDISTAVEFISFVDSTLGFKDKNIADFGCGKGTLGIGAALLGAASVDMYDIDGSMVLLSKRNCKKMGLSNCKIYKKDVFDVDKVYDIIISNPPFGFQSTFDIEAFISKLKKVGKSFFFIYKLNQRICDIAGENSLLTEYLGSMALPKCTFFHRREKITIPVCVVYKV
jgi:predicted RNA methylase